MHRIKVYIRTLSPVVLSSTSNSTVMTETHSAISGSIIRGITASRFIEVQKLTDEAHDETFREIFFGGLSFLPANPEIKGQRSFVLPLSLQSGKSGTPDSDKVQDLLADEESRQGYKSFRGFGILKNEKFFTAQVLTNMFMHMSRSSESERLAGRNTDGAIYNYEAIDSGQNFHSEIIGDEKTLRKLRDCLNLDDGKMIAYVGRSRFTQYGRCLVTFGNIEPIDEQNLSDKISLRLDTPLIPADDNFISAEKVLQTEIIGKLGKKFSLGKIFASSVEIENFVVPWGMKRPRVMALAAGTVFGLKVVAPLSDDEQKIFVKKIYGGLGMRTEEGFGQLRLWTSSKNLVKGKLDDETISCPKEFSAYTVNLAKKILSAHLSKQVRLYAQEDAEKLCPQLKRGNLTHFFLRLNGILSSVDRKNLRRNFKERLESEIRDGSQFEEHLKNLYMANEQKFFDVLTGQASLPHEVRDLISESDLEKIRGDIEFTESDFSDDKFFAEYLTNYFRFARKIAAASKESDNRE